jgi:hypothetical protein
MDKAALLGEVVRHVRELRAKASDATDGVPGAGILPEEIDEVGVVEEHVDDHQHRCCYGGAGHVPRRVRAWVCCAERPGLLSDIGRAVRSASARPVRAEIATVGGRTRSVLELDVCDGDDDRWVDLSTLRAVLRNVLLDREEHHRAASEGYKRPRFSPQIGEVQRKPSTTGRKL